MHPFSTPWKHQKTLRFSDAFRSVEKEWIGNKWVKFQCKGRFNSSFCHLLKVLNYLPVFLFLLFVLLTTLMCWKLSWISSTLTKFLPNFCFWSPESIKQHLIVWCLQVDEKGTFGRKRVKAKEIQHKLQQHQNEVM